MTFFSAITTLLLVMDPLGNIPICLSVLRSVKENRRAFIIVRESSIACLILLTFFFLGQYILAEFHISQAALTISGGVMLFLIALKMVFPPPNEPTDNTVGEPLIVPLAIPLLAGPSSIAMVMLFASQAPYRINFWVSAIVISSVISMLILLSAVKLRRFFGTNGLIALERLMGMLLITLSVQMFLDGISDYFHLPH